MNFFDPKTDSVPGNYNLVGIVFDTPRFKRKNHPTKTLYPEKIWHFDIFISSSRRIQIELVENCKEQKPNLASSGGAVCGGVVILKNVRIYEDDRGLMECRNGYEILVFNPHGDDAMNFIKERETQIPLDESLSSNGKWEALSERSQVKLRQSIRLAWYYQHLKSANRNILNKPKTMLEKAINDHFKGGINDLPSEKLENYKIGVAIALNDKNLTLAVKNDRTIIIQLQDELKDQLNWFQNAVKKRLIILLQNLIENNDASFSLKTMEGSYVFDSYFDESKRYCRYIDFLSVSKLNIYF